MGSGLFTVPQDGRGQYAFSFFCSGERSTYLLIGVEKNGSVKFVIADDDYPNAEGANISYYWLEDLQAGDTIRLKVYGNSGYDDLHSSPSNFIIFNGFRLS